MCCLRCQVYPDPRHERQGACDPAAYASLPVYASTAASAQMVMGSGRGFMITLPPLRLCGPARLTFQPLSGALDAQDVENLEVYVHFFTSADGKGSACATPSDACVRMSRRLPVVVDTGYSMHAQFNPDPSSFHYMYSFHVGSPRPCHTAVPCVFT